VWSLSPLPRLLWRHELACLIDQRFLLALRLSDWDLELCSMVLQSFPLPHEQFQYNDRLPAAMHG